MKEVTNYLLIDPIVKLNEVCDVTYTCMVVLVIIIVNCCTKV